MLPYAVPFGGYSAGLESLIWSLLLAPTIGARMQISDEDRDLICNAPFVPKAADAEQIRWLHIPKTGTSFANTIWHYGCNIPEAVSVTDFTTRFEGTLNDTYPRELWCPGLVDHTPATHKPVGEIEWDNHKGNFVAMFRNPADRISSAFRYNSQCIKDCNPENSALSPCDSIRDPVRRESTECKQIHGSRCLTEYSGFRAAQGCQTKLLLGYPCSADVPIEEAETTAAVSRLRDGFSFVGLVEEWSLSVCLFHRILGGKPLPAESDHVRPGVADNEPADCPAPIEAAGDKLDEPVYAEAERIFDAQVQRALHQIRKEQQAVSLVATHSRRAVRKSEKTHLRAGWGNHYRRL